MLVPARTLFVRRRRFALTIVPVAAPAAAATPSPPPFAVARGLTAVLRGEFASFLNEFAILCALIGGFGRGVVKIFGCTFLPVRVRGQRGLTSAIATAPAATAPTAASAFPLLGSGIGDHR
jgi:hypothetical protein